MNGRHISTAKAAQTSKKGLKTLCLTDVRAQISLNKRAIDKHTEDREPPRQNVIGKTGTGFPLEGLAWVDRHTVQMHLVMQVRTSGEPGVANFGNPLTTRHTCA